MNYFYWFALKAVPHVGNVAFRRLLDRFGTPENVFRASPAQLASVKGLHPSAISSITGGIQRADAERECAAAERNGARIVTCQCDEYPKPLLQVPDHPPFLYVRGSLYGEAQSIAIVGSRKASAYGLNTAEKLARELSSHGITIVSGMARGIDAAAHGGALKAGGSSIGVLGCGIDVVYPRENRRLYEELPGKGALVSEFPMGTEPRSENFPRRNRIISGISRGVVVVEAAENSGSLITAQCALDQGREVFAVPGNINFSSSRGTNKLIKQGAKLVEGIGDILEELPLGEKMVNLSVKTVRHSLGSQEAKVLALLDANPLHIDEIILKSALTAGEVSAILLRLELLGTINQLPGMYFSIS